MGLGMLTTPVARVIEHRRRRLRAAKGSIIPHVDPTSPSVGLALGQDRNGRIVAMQPLGCKNVCFDTLEKRLERRAARSDLVSQGGQAQRHTFSGVTFGLAVERLMLSELLEQDHGE
jgi:hypothetical protein